jgi:transposase
VFRRKAIFLARSSDEKYPISRRSKELAHQLDTLRNWLKQDEIEAGEREGLITEERK